MKSKDFLFLIAEALHRLPHRHSCWPALLMWSGSLVFIYSVWHLILLPQCHVFWIFSGCSLYCCCCSYATSKTEKNTLWSLATACLLTAEPKHDHFSFLLSYSSTDKTSICLILQTYISQNSIFFFCVWVLLPGAWMKEFFPRPTPLQCHPFLATYWNLWLKRWSWVSSPRKRFFGVMEY